MDSFLENPVPLPDIQPEKPEKSASERAAEEERQRRRIEQRKEIVEARKRRMEERLTKREIEELQAWWKLDKRSEWHYGVCSCSCRECMFCSCPPPCCLFFETLCVTAACPLICLIGSLFGGLCQCEPAKEQRGAREWHRKALEKGSPSTHMLPLTRPEPECLRLFCLPCMNWQEDTEASYRARMFKLQKKIAPPAQEMG